MTESPLDKRLAKILLTKELKISEAILAIRGAYEEAGYKQIGSTTPEIQRAIANIITGNKVMTGSYWLARFEKELRKTKTCKDPEIMQVSFEPHYHSQEVLAAARRATKI